MWQWRTGNWVQRRNKTRKILVIYWRYDPPLNFETAWLFCKISTSSASQSSNVYQLILKTSPSASSSPPLWGGVELYWLCASYFTGRGPVKEEEGHDIQWSEFCNLSVLRFASPCTPLWLPQGRADVCFSILFSGWENSPDSQHKHCLLKPGRLVCNLCLNLEVWIRVLSLSD